MILRGLVDSGDLERVIATVPFFTWMGLEIDRARPSLTTHLPFRERHVGNEMIGALHGGIVAAFLEATATIALVADGKLERVPKPINLTVDYLRSAKTESLYGEATIAKLGRRVASLRATCWQEDRNAPVADAICHFLVGG